MLGVLGKGARGRLIASSNAAIPASSRSEQKAAGMLTKALILTCVLLFSNPGRKIWSDPLLLAVPRLLPLRGISVCTAKEGPEPQHHSLPALCTSPKPTHICRHPFIYLLAFSWCLPAPVATGRTQRKSSASCFYTHFIHSSGTGKPLPPQHSALLITGASILGSCILSA